MIGPLLFLQTHSPDAHYAGGASSKIAGTTAFAGKLFRFLFTTVPQWVQIAGIVIGGPIALIVAWQLWKHRRELWAWFKSRSLRFKLGMAGAFAFVGVIGGGTGLVSYNYLMHDNDFCQSCHIMDTAWNRFQVSAHKGLQCHACHRQPLYVSSVELYYWVTQRLMAVPPHDKVPNAVCEECHRRSETDSSRTNVMMTAGHALHLKSDSSALKNVQCVTCHGRDFHKFVPNNATCQQSGCHATQKVKLGLMSTNGFFHCSTCHDFKTRVPAGVTPKQAAKALAPHALECSTCHQMSDKIAGFDLASDPHKGSCGSCHDPHKQTEPKEAYKTCANNGCHVQADTLTSFHRGLGPHKIDQCGSCHQAHSWKVKGTDCLSCHKTIFQDKPGATPARKPGFKEPAPATTESRVHEISASRGRLAPGRAPVRLASFVRSPGTRRAPRHASDSVFLHSRHKNLDCLQCHATSDKHGALKITRPDGCLGCHHGAAQKAACATCHTGGPVSPYPVSVTFKVSARKEPPVTRSLAFAHARHAALECTNCHGGDVKRTVPAASCNTCHADHHAAARDCASCHPTARAGHDRTAHEGCAGCHTDVRVASLTVSRSLCLSCHQEQRNHHTEGDCAACHAVVLHPGAKADRTP